MKGRREAPWALIIEWKNGKLVQLRIGRTVPMLLISIMFALSGASPSQILHILVTWFK
jgi:hypothetical protein